MKSNRRSNSQSYYRSLIDRLIISHDSRKTNSEISKISARIDNDMRSDYSQKSTVTRFSARVTNDTLSSSSHMSSVSRGYGSRVNFDITSFASSRGIAPPGWTSRVHSAIRSNTSAT
ncbi:hypothetical protein JHK82_050260 [Glycine max]|nr:hypothetical protein JHK87_049927 [Glycine soja]KAG5091482.1 hypothetical protein JHK82_050260 [Glycine max]